MRELYRGKGPKGSNWSNSWFDNTLVPYQIADQIIEIIFHGGQPPEESDDATHPVLSQKSRATNFILYGPPGTGKTYHSIERAVKLIDPSFSGDSHEASQTAGSMRLYAKGGLEFVTFHQCIFLRGLSWKSIRPCHGRGRGKRYRHRYECREGRSRDCRSMPCSVVLIRPKRQRGGFLSMSSGEPFLSKIESEPEAKYPGLSGKTSFRLTPTPRGNLEGVNVFSNKKFLCTRKILRRVYSRASEARIQLRLRT